MALVETDHEHVAEPAAQIVANGNGATAVASSPAPAVGAESGSAWLPRSWALTALGVDLLMFAATVFTAEVISGRADVTRMSFLWVIGFVAIALTLLYKRGLYDWRVRLQTLDDLRRVLIATVLALAGILALRMLLGRTEDVSAQSVRLWALAAVYLVTGRLVLQWLRFETRVGGEMAKPTLIIGAGKIGQLVASRLSEHPEFGLRPVGFLDKEPLADPDASLPILGASWDLEEVIEEHGIEHVIVAFSTAPSEVLLREVQRCELAGVGVSLVPRLFEYMTERVTVEHIGGLPLVSTRRIGPNGWQFAVKYTVDRVLAAFLLVLLSPVLLLLAIGVVISAGWPVLFRQTRVGLDGREFEIVKFRTMTHVPEDPPELEEVLMVNIAPGGVEGVDRRTRFGSLIRRLSLDELPQLINVVKGEMSLIGPRPERPHFVEIFQRTIPRYADRHRVRPGITGWAQIHGLRGKTSLSDRIEWDNYYVENWSLWLDFKIMLTTLFILGHHSKQTE
jgi:exopolysaccharide biosynthesis polyprenyl glycosylphosphotransferase